MTEPVTDGYGLRCAVERAGDRSVIAVTGELDLATVDEFAATVEAELRRGPVLLDLSQLRFMDSSGVRVLDTFLRGVDREAWTLTIGSALRPGVRQVLEMTGMLGFLPIEAVQPAEPDG